MTDIHLFYCSCIIQSYCNHFFQAIWFSRNGSRCGTKAAGKIEYRLEHIRRSLPRTEKANVASKRRKLNFDFYGTTKVNILLFKITDGINIRNIYAPFKKKINFSII